MKGEELPKSEPEGDAQKKTDALAKAIAEEHVHEAMKGLARA